MRSCGVGIRARSALETNGGRARWEEESLRIEGESEWGDGGWQRWAWREALTVGERESSQAGGRFEPLGTSLKQITVGKRIRCFKVQIDEMRRIFVPAAILGFSSRTTVT